MWLHEWVNNSTYKIKFENPIRSALERGQTVRVSIMPHFREGEAAPFQVEVWAASEKGIVVKRQLIPTPGFKSLPLPSAGR
jgi:hypothetical protein